MATIIKLTLFKKEKAKLKIFWTKILLFLLTKIKYYSIIKVEKGGKIMIYGCYTFKELQEKYGWTCTQGEIQKQITYARNRGVLIEKAFKQGKTYFKILNDNNPPEEEWETYVNDPYFEVTKGGMVRTSTDKKIVSTKNTDGYLTVTSSNPNNYGKTYRVHRMIMETFNPIENCENYYVDHINGIRSDDRLENLRWVTSRQNSKYRDENYEKMNKNYQKMIEKFGYIRVNEIFEMFLNEK